MPTTIDTRTLDNGRKFIRVSGPSFAAVQNAIFDITDGCPAGGFSLPRRLNDHYEAQGFVFERTAQPQFHEQTI